MTPYVAPSSLKIIQTNLQHKQIAMVTLRRVLETNQHTIALIQEPWIRNNKICGLNNIGGKLFLDYTAEKPRSCIYIPKNMETTLLNQFCSRDITAVKILTEDQTALVLASVYMPIDGEVPPKELADMVQHCEANNWNMIISADCNAHHPLWGSGDTNKRGKLLTEYLFKTNLSILNNGKEPTFISSRYQTTIDITLATYEAISLVEGWHVSTEPSFADHRRICFQLNLKPPKPTLYRNPRKTDVGGYINLVNKKLNDAQFTNATLSTHNIETNIELLTTSLVESYEQNCPMVSQSNMVRKSWWGSELERLRHNLRTLFNRAKNTRAAIDWDKYKAAQKHYKKRIRYRRTEAWRKFCNGINSTNQAVRVKKILSKGNLELLGSLKKDDGTYTSTDLETNTLLLETHFPGCIITTDYQWEEKHYDPPTKSEWEVANKVVTVDKTAWAINSFNPYKSGGLDGIFPALLHWNLETIIEHLIPIYKACLAFKYIPKAWRDAKVIFLPKPGKDDYTQAKAFRPISLTSFLLKTLERLVDRYLRDGILTHNPLHSQQHAYRKGKSTESALHSVVQKIEKALTNKESTLAAFIDIEGAFDKTMHNSISHALQKLNLDPAIEKWITELVSVRAVQIKAGTTIRAKVVRGCPQGGVLSPLLWNIVVDSLIRKLNERGFTTVGYADDLAILVNGKAENILCNILHSALQILERWCEEHKLSVNPKKTELVLFTNKRKLPNLQLPKLFGTKLTLSAQVKYLGVILDNKLNWASHLEEKSRKACISFWQCRRLVGKTWGLSPKITLWLYTAVIRPTITYGSVVWWPRTQLTTVKEKLRSLQRLACVAVTGCMRTTPSASLEFLLNLRPLHLFIQEEATAAALRLKMNGLWKQDTDITHTTLVKKVIQEIPLLEAPLDKIQCLYNFDRRYAIRLKAEAEDNSGVNEVRIYTDGSKTANGTGAGVFSNDLNIRISTPLDRLNTIFQAECLGIIRAAQAVATRGIREYNIKIVSDSASVLQALQNRILTSSLVLECHNTLQSIAVTNNVTLQWIKGHSNSSGNDAADQLAKKGASMVIQGPQPMLPIPQAQVRKWLRDRTESKHHLEWGTSEYCRQTKAAVPAASHKLTRNLIRLNREKIRKIVGVLTGHCPLNKHLHTLGITDSPLCRGCMEAEETASHVMLECCSVADQRAHFLQSPGSLREACSDISRLLAFWGDIGWLE